MVDAVHQLIVNDIASEKIGRRGISDEEALQLIGNSRRIVRNTGRHRRVCDLRTRKMLIGRTNGGRTLTLVIEQTIDPTTWLVVTGWESTSRERKILRGEYA
jgi:uncharacterized DUF497 family protein